MRVLQTCEYCLQLCGLFSNRSSGYFKSINTLVVGFGVISEISMSVGYVYQNITSLDESIKSFLTLFSGLYIFFGYIGTAKSMSGITTLHKELQGIVDNGNFDNKYYFK